MSPDPNAVGRPREPWAALRRFARPRAAAGRCELCGAELAEDHRHLVEPSTRRMLCACDACGILFSDPGAGRFRRVPRRVVDLSGHQLSDDRWARLGIPIGLAFFLRGGHEGQAVAIYPSPAGPIETLLDPDVWDDLSRDIPILAEMEPDTEALLVNRIRDAHELFLMPVDECYKLIGLIRTHWTGFTGGPEVWQAIDRSFAALRQRPGSS